MTFEKQGSIIVNVLRNNNWILGNCVTVARQTLTLFVGVRIPIPQPKIWPPEFVREVVFYKNFSRYTGEQRLFDTTKLNCSAFKSLNDNNIFENSDIFHGVIIWNNCNIDIVPETVYQSSYLYKKYILYRFQYTQYSLMSSTNK